ncbi:MAG: PAS domain-containing protein [Rhodoferax sp.]|nr:PAS domain-containing protein [Rhodoferax sp.]
MPQTQSKLADLARTQWRIAIFVLLVFGLFLAYFILHERTLTLERERDRLFTQVRVIDTLLSQQLAGVNEAMLSMRPQGRVSPQDTAENPERSATMRVLTNAMPTVRTMLMIDPQGLVVSSNRTDTLGFDASRREYFTMVKNAPNADMLYMSGPFKTSLGVYAINLARAWTGDQNALLGITTATLNPDYFNVLLRSVLYAEDMRASLIHGDGLVFLTQPENGAIQGSDLKKPDTLFTQHAESGREESFFNSLVPLTDDTRLVVYRTVWPPVLHMDKPLMLAVSRGQAAVLMPWRQLATVLALTYAGVCALTAGAIFFFRRRHQVLQQLAQTRAREAREQAERLDLALEGGNLGLFDLDMVTGIRRVNARAQEIVGDGPEDPVDTFATWSERVHPDDRPAARALRDAHERGETPSLIVEYRIRHKQGHWVWVHSRGRVTQRREDGTPLRLVGTYVDITERLHAERVLREERLRLSNIIAGTSAGTWEHDLTTGTDQINDEYAHMLGYTAEEMAPRINGDFRNIVHPDDLPQVTALWEAHLAGTTPVYEAEFRVMHKDGHWVWVMSHGKVWSRDADGRALNISGIHLDVSAIKTVQARLEELNGQLETRVHERTAELEATLEQLRESQQSLASSEARATMSTLVAGLSHEIGTPLGNSIIAASTVSAGTRDFRKLLADGGLKRSGMNHFMELVDQGADIIESNLRRANELMKNFRQVAADQASEQRRTFDLAQAVKEILQTLSPTLKRHPHRVTLDIADGIAMDSLPGPMGQIIINLINNAYLHAFEGMAQGELVLSARADGDWVTLEVRDNGRGIPPENLKKLFEPFFSTKIGKGGTGLGMAIVKNLVTKSLGGSIEVVSVVGQGATFTIRLPRVLPATVPVVA